jgi:predicted Zn-ribbon and HTH transcriptional regulator
VLRADLSGLTFDTKIPQQCVQYDCAANGEAVLTKLTLNTKAVAKSGKTYIKSPATCPTAGWTFKATLKYDAPTAAKNLSSVQKCTK